MARHALDGDPLVIEMREIDRHVRSGMGARSHQTAIHADCPESLWHHPRISDVVVQHVDALAVGDFHHFGDNFLRGVIDAEISAKLLAEYDALVSPGNRDHARFKHVLGYLDTDGAEIAAGAHYQHGLAGFQRCDMYEQIPRRRHVAQHHRGAMKIETLGNGDCGAGGNRDLLGEPAAATWSPTFQRVTCGPTASTMPAQSTPGIRGSPGPRAFSLPARRLTSSTRFTVAACTVMRISPARGTGSRHSS